MDRGTVMNENSKEIRELTESMRAEKDIRIRNRVMVVLYAPTAASRPSTVEFVWKYTTYRIVTSEHYEI